jgi:hypothetical protein
MDCSVAMTSIMQTSIQNFIQKYKCCCLLLHYLLLTFQASKTSALVIVHLYQTMNCAGGIQAEAEVPENNDRKYQEFRHSGETGEYQEIWQDEEHSIRRYS